MKRILAVLIGVSAAMPVAAEPVSRYIVALKSGAAGAALRMTSNATGSAPHGVREFTNANFVAADLTASDAAALRKTSGVAHVSPVVPRYASDVPHGPRLPRQQSQASRYAQWQTIPAAIDLIHAREVWGYPHGSSRDVNVAVLDTGVEFTHPDLEENYAGGYNAINKDADPADDYGHGTHVAGTIAAGNNGFGVVGVAPEVRFWAVKVLDATGGGTDETVMAGIDWVINKKRAAGGNWIINMSLGANRASDAERAMVARALDENILIVAAAGNAGVGGIDFPAAYPGVLAVSAIDPYNSFADFSNYGAGIAFAAPGVDILSTVPVGSVTTASIMKSWMELSALPLVGSAFGQVTAKAVFCGIGRPEDFPRSVQGNIAIIRRGEILFHEKVKNAVNAGAVAVVVVPVLDDPLRDRWTLLLQPQDENYPWPLVVSTNFSDGEALISTAGRELITISYSTDDYADHTGTSMATPHVTGVAALVWSVAPRATASQIALAMKLTAVDLGPRGYDVRFGYGRIDALAAARYVAPSVFGVPAASPPPDNRRRSARPGH